MNTQPDKTIAGVDLGKKYRGNTVLCVVKNETVTWYQTPEKTDDDRFLYSHLSAINPQSIFIDAPLSLPGVFRLGEPFDDYFFRESDRQVRAMSPMFLAGLSARGIQLKDQLAKAGLTCYEAYPSYLARELGLKDNGYKELKSSLPTMEKLIKQYFYLDFPDYSLQNWHQLDALLTTLTGIRFYNNQHLTFGNPKEGVILV